MQKDEEMSFLKKDIMFITADTSYIKKGLRESGYTVMHPYNYKTIIGRLLLEILVKLRMPQGIIYNKKILHYEGKYIIVQDPIITRRFLLWLKKNMPDKQLIYAYTNLAGRARNLMPDQIPEGIDVWTYDKADSEKYGILFPKSAGYLTSYIGMKREKKYDIVYVGRDKGRAEYILELKARFEKLGLTIKFLIMPSMRTSHRKKYYSKPIPYEEVINLVNESRAVLNITLPGQTGATMRDYESIYNEVKLITTNPGIKEYDFYNKKNIFILGEDDLNELHEFLNTPFEKIEPDILEKYTIDAFVKELICG